MASLTHGKCPHCQSAFDAKTAIPSFSRSVAGKQVLFVYALCPKCSDKYNWADGNKQKGIIKTSHSNVTRVRSNDWTVTSSLALDTHLGDFFCAWWYGIDIPKAVFDGINDGLIEEYTILPLGIGEAV